MGVWADVRKPLAPDEPPPEMPSVWAVPDSQPVPMSSPVANVRGPRMQLSTNTAQQGDLAKIAARDTLTNDIDRLNDTRWKQAHPWGSADNHPGKLGKIAHAFSVLGNVAGNIVAPNVMANIPGTQLNMQEKEQGLAKKLDTDVQHQSEDELHGAQSRNLTAEAARTEAEQPYVAPSAEAKNRLENAQATELENTAAAGPNLATGYAHAVNDAMKRGVDPAQDPIVQHIADAITSIQKQPAPKDEQTKTATYIPPGGTKPMEFQWDPKTNKYDIPLGEHYERPITVNNNPERKERGEILKIYQPALDSGERFNVMNESFLKAVKDHDQQAMLNLLANHLGMTMGLQKGARLTKDIVQEAQHSLPFLQGIKAKFGPDGYATGVNLSPEQMRQMVDLGRSRFSEDAVKARSAGRYLGDTGDGPDRIPNEATIKYYKFLANGDGAKAKALAAQDGWSVK